ncbi:fructokinase [Thiomicrospira aerophila AL3]|uniref:Fructokinase n=1 Tax=Thiomicrospira aerophila AL3 TaxID=717772 RepID=W0DRC3_9GAMM|nr:ROK family protein [Thiomicrospira aerophila]AHF01007.1 fructokinase [Thiomicrospira aerophila AL3]
MNIGIDLGGTKIEIALVNNQHEIIYRYREPTIRGDYASSCQQLIKLIAQVEQLHNLANLPIGIGIPGSIAKQSGLVKNANSTWLNGQPLLADLNRALDGRVRIANDANCFALSEALFGHAKGAETVLGVIIGTGCGAGLVVNGQLIHGLNGIGGEWGHNAMPWVNESDRVACYCGLENCIETYLSGPGWLLRSKQRYQLDWSDAKALYTDYQQGGLAAQQAFDDYVVNLAKGLASVINIFDPDVIILGGGLGQMTELYQRVPAIWQNWVFSDLVETRLLAPKLGDSSGVLGAAGLWPFH